MGDRFDAIRQSGIQIYFEVGSEDVFGFHAGCLLLHQALYEHKIVHEYRYVAGAHHTGSSLSGRVRDGLMFLDKVINPPAVDEDALAFNALMKQMGLVR